MLSKGERTIFAEKPLSNGIVWLMHSFIALTGWFGKYVVIKTIPWKGFHMWLFDKIAKVQNHFVERSEAWQEEKLWHLRSAAWGRESVDKQVALAHRAGFITAVEYLCLNHGQKDYVLGETLSVFTCRWVEPMRRIEVFHCNEINKRMNVSTSSFRISFEGKETCGWDRNERGDVGGFRLMDANAKWMGPLMYLAREARRPSQVKHFAAPVL